MGKIALITDMHYGVRSDAFVFYDYYNKFNQQFFETIDEQKITNVIMLGDLFDRRKYINYVTAARCRQDFFEPLSSRNINVRMIAGNHDVYYKNTNDVSSLKELLKGYNFNIYIDPVEIEIDSTKILLLPWITESNYDKTHKIIKKTKAQICFGHLELNGFEMYRGIKNEGGMERSILNKFEIVASGHFHHRSIKDNIHYIGAAYEQTWADYADARGFSIFDTQTREMEFVINPNHLFHMITYDDVNEIDKIKNQIKKSDFSRFNGCYLKIVIVNKTDPYLFDMFLDKIYSYNPVDITLVEDISLFVETDPDSEIDQAEDTLTILNKYVDGIQVNSNLDSYRMKNMIKSIYNEAIATEDNIAHF